MQSTYVSRAKSVELEAQNAILLAKVVVVEMTTMPFHQLDNGIKIPPAPFDWVHLVLLNGRFRWALQVGRGFERCTMIGPINLQHKLINIWTWTTYFK